MVIIPQAIPVLVPQAIEPEVLAILVGRDGQQHQDKSILACAGDWRGASGNAATPERAGQSIETAEPGKGRALMGCIGFVW